MLYKKQVWQSSCREWNGGEVLYELQLSHDLSELTHRIAPIVDEVVLVVLGWNEII